MGLVLFALLLYRADWVLLRRSLADLELSYLFVLHIFTVLMIAVRAWRWNMLLRVHNAAFSPWRAW